MDIYSFSVKELTKMCNELNISLTKSDRTKKLKKDLVKSLQLGGKRKKSRKTSKKKSRRRKSRKVSRKRSRKSSKKKSRRRKSRKVSRKRSRKSSKKKSRKSSKKKSRRSKKQLMDNSQDGGMKHLGKMYKTKEQKMKEIEFNNLNNSGIESDKDRLSHWDNEFLTWLKNKDRESSSGVGSTINLTQNTIQILNTIISKHNITSLIDIPCGDMNWMSNFLKDYPNIIYTGFDISPSLIKYNKIKYPSLSFSILDIVNNTLSQKTDLILCRDLLFHMHPTLGMKTILNLKASGSRWLLTSTFPNRQNKIQDIAKGTRFYPINLNSPPFNMPKPKYIYNENEQDKYLALWDLHDPIIIQHIDTWKKYTI